MQVILLSGGSGKRLWPLSNNVRSKQFLKLFKSPSGEYESMVQRVYRQIREADPDARITIATSKNQVSSIHNQLGSSVGICVEPCRRDTFPAIALAAVYLNDVGGVPRDEAVAVCPVDPYVDVEYFKTVRRLTELAAEGKSNLVLMGIEPVSPSDRYGYVIPCGAGEYSEVQCFKEKPSVELAREYITQGALWNGGVFAFKLGYVLDRAHELIDFKGYEDLFAKYGTLSGISFDYAVVENETQIGVLRYRGKWKDLGTWSSLTEEMNDRTIGKVILDPCCENVNVVNELDVPIVCVGVKDVIVSASADGILVADRSSSDGIKSVVEGISQSAMFAEKSWGTYRVIDAGEQNLTIKVNLKAGQKMSLHSHEFRDEVWTVVSGKGTATVDGVNTILSAGSVVRLPAGSIHTVEASEDLCLIEVQVGKDISVRDKKKHTRI